MSERVIFHIDVNSAFLSWEAVERLKNGEQVDEISDEWYEKQIIEKIIENGT